MISHLNVSILFVFLFIMHSNLSYIIWFPIPKQIISKSTNSLLFSLNSHEMDTINLYESRRESVVYISKLSHTFNPLFMNVMEFPSLTGSGFVWNDDYIITNNHVVENQKEVFVTFVNKLDGARKGYRATVRGGDKEKDIAVLKLINDSISIQLPPPLPLGTSSQLRVGQTVLAIGNPFGLDQTLTSGIISGLGRQIKTTESNTIYDMIQTDAAINPGISLKFYNFKN